MLGLLAWGSFVSDILFIYWALQIGFCLYDLIACLSSPLRFA